MQAYYEFHLIRGRWVCDIVTSQDYHEGGPFARSFRSSPPQKEKADALKMAEAEAARWMYKMVEGPGEFTE